MRPSPRLQRLTAMSVTALLAANAMVLVVGIADDANDEQVTTQGDGRTLALIEGADGKQILVDPNTPEGQQAIADAQKRGDKVSTVAASDVPAESLPDGGVPGLLPPGVTIPTLGDIEDLLHGTESTIVQTVDDLGDTIDDTVDDVTDTIDDTTGLDTGDIVDPAVDDGTDTLTTTVSTIVDTGNQTATTIVNGTTGTTTTTVHPTTTTTVAVTTTTVAPTTTTTTVVVPTTVTVPPEVPTTIDVGV
jgi:hypothetical protein